VSVRSYTPDEILHLIRKNRWFILIPLALGIAAAPLLARFAEARYRSEALLLVVPQQVPQDYVQATVTESVADRLPSITAQILSRSKLEKIIVDMHLYEEEREHEVMEDVVDMMRTRDVKTTAVGRDINSFRISFVNEDAETARKVTEKLASLYIEQNLRDRSTQADNTSQFLGAQLEQAKQRLVEQEKKIEAYKRSHPGQLPSQLEANMQAVQNVALQLQALSAETNRALERRLLLERQIADTETLVLPTNPSSDALTTADKLRAARGNLETLLQRYTPEHPLVREAQATVAELTTQSETEQAAVAKGGTSKPSASLSTTEAARQKRLLDLRAELLVVDHQLKQAREDDAKLKQSINNYQARVDVVPTRESELVELTRDYSTLNAAYTNLLMKREDANISANLERRQIGERFEVLDPASRPEKPYNNLQRIAVVVSGALAGLLIGLAVVGVREYRDSSFRGKDEVVKALSLPVLASIPIMASAREREAAHRRRRAMDVGGSVLLLASVSIVVVWRLFS
jgi:polysaccharide chain length determinant protein (PEP-CTERM system associated)